MDLNPNLTYPPHSTTYHLKFIDLSNSPTEITTIENSSLSKSTLMEVKPIKVIPASKVPKEKESSTISKKRKAEEVEEEWEELGDPIKGEKAALIKPIEEKSKKFIPGFCINLPWCKSCEYFKLLEVLEA